MESSDRSRSASITVDGQQVAYSNVSTPAEMDLSGVDIVIDATGAYRTPELLQPYFDAGVKKVIVAAPGQRRRTQHCHGLQ